MQQQQAIHTSQEDVSDSMLPALNILTDSPKSQDKEENENQEALKEANVRNQQRQVTQQPTDSINLDFCSETPPTITPIKEKKRRRCCCRRAKEQDEECCDDSDTWVCCGSGGSGGGSVGGGSVGGGSVGGSSVGGGSGGRCSGGSGGD